MTDARGSAGRDLFVTPFTPALGTGGRVGTYGVVRALAMSGPLDLLYVPHGEGGPSPEYRAIGGLDMRPVPVSRGARRALTYARLRAGGIPPAYARGVSSELVSAAAQAAASPGRGRVIADGLVVAAALLGLARQRPVIYSGHDLESAFHGEVKDRAAADRRRIERFERRVIASYAESWMVSPPDVEGARALAPGADVRYVPPVVDVAAIRPVSPPGGRRILYVASFGWEPNRAGLRFLVDEVMPRLWAQLPDAHLAVVGGGLDGPPSDDARVEALGFVDDLPAQYAASDCAVVPVHKGGGAPVKFIEALAYGMPIVATPKAGAALQIEAGEHYLEADSGEEFAAQLGRILRGEAPALPRAARALAERMYSIEAVARRIAPDVRGAAEPA